MARNLYITAMEPQSGKSLVALGVMELLSARVERLGFTMARWVEGEAIPLAELESQLYGYGAVDIHGSPVVLFKGEWQLDSCAKAFPRSRFVELGNAARRVD